MAEPLRALPEADLFRELDKLLDQLAPDVSRILREALGDVRNNTDREALTAAIKAHDWDRALEAVPWEDLGPGVLKAYRPDGPVGSALKRGADLGLRLLPGGATGGPSGPSGTAPYDYAKLADAARSYLQRQGAERVAHLTDTSRAGFRRILSEAFSPQGRSVASTSRELRDVLNARQANGLIGVTERDAERLSKELKSWTADPDLSAKQIQGRVDRLHAKKIRLHCDLIAGTELQDAGNEGQVALWKERNASGEIRILGLEAYFVSDKGERVKRPILHWRCACSQRLVRVGPGVYVREWVTRIRGVCERCKAFDGKKALEG